MRAWRLRACARPPACAGRTDVNMFDVEHALEDLGVSLESLQDFVSKSEPIAFARGVPFLSDTPLRCCRLERTVKRVPAAVLPTRQLRPPVRCDPNVTIVTDPAKKRSVTAEARLVCMLGC